MRLRALFQQAAVGIELLSIDGRFLEVNDKLCEVLDTPRPELLGRSYRELTHPEDRADEDRLLKRLLERRLTSYAVEKRYLRTIPIDPIAQAADKWISVSSEDPDDIGIKDVKSGAEGAGENGIPYAEW